MRFESLVRKFLDLEFYNDFVGSLPGDPSTDASSREVLNACYSFVSPTNVSSPKLIAWSDQLAESLGLLSPVVGESEQVAGILSGNSLRPGMRPYSACYGGHQFGHWAGQLGDGRAITLGEFKDLGGKSWELQLKGAGRTPYSRHADGRAVLRSSLREFLCSEAMHGLGIPSTRALSLVLTGDEVVRDMFYDGRPAAELGAITARVAPSFLRFGNFQILSARGEYGNLRTLTDYAISRFSSDLMSGSEPQYTQWFEDICVRTAKLMVDWQRTGFVHGVMNTDNMSILGLTIDYGPYGWLEGFDPSWTPNTTDAAGRRYCYGRQPQIAYWNLQRFGEALLPLFEGNSGVDKIKHGLDRYVETFNKSFFNAFAQKIGLQRCRDRADETLITDLMDLLKSVETDMTIFFRRLAEIDPAKISAKSTWDNLGEIFDAFYNLSAVPPSHQQEVLDWMRRYARRFDLEGSDQERRLELMNKMNPKFIFRNYLAQEIIDEIMQGTTTKLHQVLKRSRSPYMDMAGDEELCKRRPEWARFKPGCSALSCSS
jgi:uncharacterized protein YdiU (UPF0061 family)